MGTGIPAQAPASSQASTLQRLGRASWALLGIIALVLVAATALGAMSGILVPLIVAIVLGTLLEPVARWLRKIRVPAALAAVLALLLVIGLAAGLTRLVVSGFVQQLPEITKQLTNGWEAFIAWGKNLDLDPLILERIRTGAAEVTAQLSQGALGFVSQTLLGAVSVGIGVFFALFFLFFVLKDHDLFPKWAARIARIDTGLAIEIDGIVQKSLRGHFRGVALTALITAPIFMIPVILLKVPLAMSIFVLYFLLSFIPYIGAGITAVFAILIAFGSGGAVVALIVAVSLLLSNSTIQSVVNAWALGTSLKMHPVAVLLATIVGGTIAGLLGMILGPPLLAAVKSTVAAIRVHRQGQPVKLRLKE